MVIYEDEVLRRFHENSQHSIRAVAEDLGVNRDVMHYILQTNY